MYDGWNQSYKVVGKSGVVFALRDSDEASSMTVLDGNNIAATIPNRRLIRAFIMIEQRELKVEKNISVSGKCRAITVSNKHLVVSFDEPKSKIEFFDFQGNSVRLIQTAGQLKAPWFLAARPSTDKIYISDWKGGSINVLDKNKITEPLCKSPQFSPFGIAVDDDGLLYVCDVRTGEVFGVETDNGRITLLLGKKNGINQAYCTAVGLLGTRKELYVCMQNCNILTVFEIK